MDILNFLKGYKSIIGCIGAVAAFIVLVCNELANGFQFTDVQPILSGFAAMMLALGLTGKAIEIQNTLKK